MTTESPTTGNAPTRALSAYMLYTKENRAKVQLENPESKMTEITKLIANDWQRLSDAERAIWENKSKAMKEEISKNLKAPKRALSAWIIYTKENRARIKAENPNLNSMTAITKLLAKEWRTLSDEESGIYDSKSQSMKS